MNIYRGFVEQWVLCLLEGTVELDWLGDWEEAYLRGWPSCEAAFTEEEHGRLAHLDFLIKRLSKERSPEMLEAVNHEAQRVADEFGWRPWTRHPYLEAGLRALHTLASPAAQWYVEITSPWSELQGQAHRHGVSPWDEGLVARELRRRGLTYVKAMMDWSFLGESQRQEVEGFISLFVRNVSGLPDDLIAMQHAPGWLRIMRAAKELRERLDPGWTHPEQNGLVMPNPIGSWSDYFSSMEGKPLHPLYSVLDKYLPNEGTALEMACGVGQGVRHLLDRELDVWAFDAHGEPLTYLYEQVPQSQRTRLHLRVGTFEKMSLSPESLDIVVAGFCLFFMSPVTLEEKWPMIVASLRPSGLFAGQFLGVHDDWAGMGYTAQTREEVEAMLSPFEVLYFEEAERDGKTSRGTDKHWHVYHVVGRRR